MSQLEIDFEYLYKEALLKLDLEYGKLEKFVLTKLRAINPDDCFDDFDEKPLSKFAYETCGVYNISLSHVYVYINVNVHVLIFLSDERCAFIFLSLSKLFPVATVAQKNTREHTSRGKNARGRNAISEANEEDQDKGWRPNRSEVRDAFLLQVKVRTVAYWLKSGWISSF